MRYFHFHTRWYFYPSAWKEVLNPVRWYKEVRDFVHRGRHGWSDSDTWALDIHIAKTVSASIARMRVLGKDVIAWSDEDNEMFDSIEKGMRDYVAMFEEMYTGEIDDVREAEANFHKSLKLLANGGWERLGW